MINDEYFFETILLKKNCLILDFNNKLELIVKIDINKFINTPKYKLKLSRYVLSKDEINNKIIFKENLNYIIFEKIISLLKDLSTDKNFNFFTTNRLKKYINDKKLYIKERSNLGLAIKQQNIDIIPKFSEYQIIVNNNMNRKLRDKQMWDSFYMCTMKKSSNFSVPGSGKTSSVYGVYAYLSYKKLINKIIMIGPKNSFISWIDEFYECFETKKELKLFNIQEYSSINEKRKEILYNTANKNLLLFNYESINSVLDEVCSIIDNKTLLVFDEVHKIKAIEGKRAKDSLRVAQEANFAITMTGTPIPNSYIDIKNILNVLYHDEYNDFFNFTNHQLKNPDLNDIKKINNKIQPFFCRTTKEQLSVPSPNDDIILNSIVDKAQNEIFNILCNKYAKNKLVLIIRILQLESNPKMLLKMIIDSKEDFSDILNIDGEIKDIDYVDYSDEIVSLINSIDKTKKFNECINIAEKLYKENKPIIIWCIFIDSINNIKNELQKKGLKVSTISGKTEYEERNSILENFKSGKIDVLITNPHTLAESISLHNICHDAIYFEYSYNLVHLLQSKDRIHRLGLKEGQYTQYYYLQSEYTTKDGSKFSLDNKIYNRLLEKEKLMLEAIENNNLEPATIYDEDIDIIFKELKL